MNANRSGITGWVLPVRWSRGSGLQLGVEPEHLLAAMPGTRFSLELLLSAPITPADERQLITALEPWLRHPQAFQLEQRPMLWIHEPAQLSHTQFFQQRIQATTSTPPILLGGGPDADKAFEGTYDRTERIPLQALKNGLRNYESFLFHAHHRSCSEHRWQVPAVLPPDPELYENANAINAKEWLALAVAWADLAAPADQDGLVLLEGMSEHWQPDGDPTHAPSTPAKRPPCRPTTERKRGNHAAGNPALLIHGFYLDLLKQMLAPIAPFQGTTNLDLYVSTPHHQQDAAEGLLRSQGWPRFTLVGVENRGRDIAPFFLELLPRALAAGHPWVVKLHTKRSSQTPGGKEWGEHLVQSLARAQALQALKNLFNAEDPPGIVAPAGSLLPTTICLARNHRHLRQLLNSTQTDRRWFLQQRFAAGSMWAAQRSALASLASLPIRLQDFETEDSQIDGTLAHAIERLLPSLIEAQGSAIAILQADARECPPFGHPWAEPGHQEPVLP